MDNKYKICIKSKLYRKPNEDELQNLSSKLNKDNIKSDEAKTIYKKIEGYKYFDIIKEYDPYWVCNHFSNKGDLNMLIKKLDEIDRDDIIIKNKIYVYWINKCLRIIKLNR